MFKPKAAFSGFSVHNLVEAQEFYTKILGLTVEDTGMGLKLHLPGGYTIFAYQKVDHKAATFTLLNFLVDDIDESVDALIKHGVMFETYEGFHQDEKGIARGISVHRGPDIAWFKDPSGNILALLQEE